MLSIRGGRRIAGLVTEKLSEIDPAGAEGYGENLSAYGKKLDELDRRIAALLRPLPDKKIISGTPRGTTSRRITGSPSSTP